MKYYQVHGASWCNFCTKAMDLLKTRESSLFSATSVARINWLTSSKENMITQLSP